MKFLYIGLGVIVLAIVTIQLFAMSAQRDIEMYPYLVVKKYDAFEVRKYEASLFTTVTLPPNSYKESSSQGFSALAGYIFGGNERGEKIAMTAPVGVRPTGDAWVISFTMPTASSLATLPRRGQRRRR